MGPTGTSVTSAATVFRRPAGEGWLWIAGSFQGSQVGLESLLAEVDSIVGRPSPSILLTATATEVRDLTTLRQWMGADVGAHSLANPAFPDLATIKLAAMVGDDLDAWLEGFAESEAEDALLEGLGRGMHILAAGAAAEAVGSWAWSPRGEEYVGALGWLPGAVLVTGEATGDWGPARALLARRRRSYALAVRPGNLIGLGPHGEVRLSGDPPPKLLLGPGWDDADTVPAQRSSSQKVA